MLDDLLQAEPTLNLWSDCLMMFDGFLQLQLVDLFTSIHEVVLDPVIKHRCLQEAGSFGAKNDTVDSLKMLEAFSH